MAAISGKPSAQHPLPSCSSSKELKMMDETMDRISDLPTFIIHHIMSFLPAKEAARASILSKRWEKFHSSFPILDFDQHNFGCLADASGHTLNALRENREFRTCLARFIDAVDLSLSRFCNLKFSVQKLRIVIGVLDPEHLPPLLDKWIALAIENGVKELDFQILPDIKDYVHTYTLPQTVFSANFLTHLRLAGCKLEQPCYAMCFLSLKKLHLYGVYITEQMVQKLLHECHFLEDLNFFECLGLKLLCISGAHKLKILTIETLSSELKGVKIVASSLQQLTLQFPFEGQGTPVVDIAVCPNLKKFRAFNLLGQEFCTLISKFPLLEDLSLFACSSFERITISSYQLKHLSLVHCASLKAINIDAPNLLSCNFWYNPFPIISINSQCSWNIHFNCQDDHDGGWFLNFKDFLRISKKIEELSIDFLSNQSLFNLYKFSRCCNSLPIQVETLRLRMVLTDISPSEYEILLDGVFWICYPRTLSLSTVNKGRPFIVWLYDYLRNPAKKCCCSDHTKSWWHYLKDAKIESFKLIHGRKFNADELHQLIDEWPQVPDGDLQLHLDWCFNDQ
ncbi:hypothetical protein CUMW_198030 [Citrus unshiu]|nr:hypothetical protein CUMW_198020 [Citrus unshiu]GAY59901.1 hypothetical protein CUMW_198030 [Citrus unshiu]